MTTKHIPESELVLNTDGSIYHLNLLPEDISDWIITVGDPDRVSAVSDLFDTVEIKKQKREFVTHTGYLGTKRISVISTGIGTDNIDIVFNELDALANIDFATRTVNNELRTLKIIRIGTSGSLSDLAPIDSMVISSKAIGLEGLLNFYQPGFSSEEKALAGLYSTELKKDFPFLDPYVVTGSSMLEEQIGAGMVKGFTATCQGFYNPQGRFLRAGASKDILGSLQKIGTGQQGHGITNFEMETAGILGMARVFGHEACSLSLILADRIRNTFSKNPEANMKKMIELVLGRIYNAAQ